MKINSLGQQHQVLAYTLDSKDGVVQRLYSRMKMAVDSGRFHLIDRQKARMAKTL